tara:strand:- start:664 stop:834 length:171 start_codon:yes stop_codon:yes gene_type:complete
MRLVLIILFVTLLSCSTNINVENSKDIDINDNLTFQEFKDLIEKKAFEKDYPDINK